MVAANRALQVPAFGALLRSWRERVGLSQERLATRAGLAVRTVRYLERGDARPHEKTVLRLIDALGLGSSEADQFAAAAEGNLAAPHRSLRTAIIAGPAQLPADVASFTGRDDELSKLDLMVARNRSDGRIGDDPAIVVAVSGMAGVGKTALVVRWAHRVAERNSQTVSCSRTCMAMTRSGRQLLAMYWRISYLR